MHGRHWNADSNDGDNIEVGEQTRTYTHYSVQSAFYLSREVVSGDECEEAERVDNHEDVQGDHAILVQMVQGAHVHEFVSIK